MTTAVETRRMALAQLGRVLISGTVASCLPSPAFAAPAPDINLPTVWEDTSSLLDCVLGELNRPPHPVPLMNTDRLSVEDKRVLAIWLSNRVRARNGHIRPSQELPTPSRELLELLARCVAFAVGDMTAYLRDLRATIAAIPEGATAPDPWRVPTGVDWYGVDYNEDAGRVPPAVSLAAARARASR